MVPAIETELTVPPAVAERPALGERQFYRSLGFIVLGALVWRLIYVQTELKYTPLTDEYWYINEAKFLFTSHPWVSPFFPFGATAQHGPATSLLIAPFVWLFPHATLGLRNVMAVVGAGTVTLFGLVGRELGGPRVGLWAAGVAAVFPDLWIRDGLVVSEPLATLTVVVAVWIALRARRKGPSWSHAVGLGVCAGVVGLTRPELLLGVGGVAIWAFWRRDLWRAALYGLLALAAATAFVAPWSVYNASRFKDTVIFSNNLGITLADANCFRSYYQHDLMGYDSGACGRKLTGEAKKISPDESVQSAWLRDTAIRYAEDHWTRVPIVLVMRELWFTGLYDPNWVVTVGTWGGQPAWATWMQAVGFYLIFLGVIVAWRKFRREKWPRVLFAILILNSFLIAAVFVGHWRYRITFDVGAVLVVALALERWQSARWRQRSALPATEPTPSAPR